MRVSKSGRASAVGLALLLVSATAVWADTIDGDILEVTGTQTTYQVSGAPGQAFSFTASMVIRKTTGTTLTAGTVVSFTGAQQGGCSAESFTSTTPDNITIPTPWDTTGQLSLSTTATISGTAGPVGVYSCNWRYSASPSSGLSPSHQDFRVNFSITEATGDEDPPVITITTPPDEAIYLLNEVVLADFECTDDSDVVLCEGPVADGAAIDTSTVGSHSFTVNAEDEHGNESDLTHTYFVVYDFDGFFRPVDNPTVLNVIKAGQGVPLKWRLTDAAGDPVTNLASASVSVANLACTLGTTADQLEEVASGASGLQNLGDGYYQFNWKTPKTYANSCKTLKLNMGEGLGASHTALFQFTK